MAHWLQYWWVLALLSGCGLAARNILFKLAGARIDPALGATILSVSMAVTALLFFAIHRLFFHQNGLAEPLPDPVSRHDWMVGGGLAVLSGIGVALANIFLSYTYQAGGPASLTAILQNALALSVTLFLGVALLKESISLPQFLGILLCVIGIMLIVRK